MVSTGRVRSGGGPGEGEGVREAAAAVAVLQGVGETAIHQRYLVLLREPGCVAKDDHGHADEGASATKTEQARRIIREKTI